MGLKKLTISDNDIMFGHYSTLEKTRQYLIILKRLDDYDSYNILEQMFDFSLDDKLNLYEEFFIKKDLFKFTYDFYFDVTQFDIIRKNINYLKFIDSIGKLDEYEKRFICKGS